MEAGQLVWRLASEGSLADIADRLAGLSRTALRAQEVTDLPALGDSKLGGQPHLPATTRWPMHAWRDGSVSALGFVAQLRLDELDPHVWPGPSTGLLSIFHAEPPGEEEEAVSVLHVPAGIELRPVPWPEAYQRVEPPKESRVRFVRELTLPAFGVSPARALEDLGFDWGEPRQDLADDYFEVCEALFDAQQIQPGAARILGWPWFSQDDVLAEQADAGLEWGDYASLLSIWRTESAVTTIALPAADLVGGHFERVRAGSQAA